MGRMTLETSVTLEAVECASCSLQWAVDEAWVTARRRDHRGFHCPNGHPLVFRGESDVEEARREAREATRALQREQARCVAARDQARAAEAAREAAQRSASAWKGHATRARRKAAHGVCPAPGCGRTFADLARHMTGQHPDFVAEHGAAKTEAGRDA